jgi:hypothetical protein
MDELLSPMLRRSSEIAHGTSYGRVLGLIIVSPLNGNSNAMTGTHCAISQRYTPRKRSSVLIVLLRIARQSKGTCVALAPSWNHIALGVASCDAVDVLIGRATGPHSGAVVSRRIHVVARPLRVIRRYRSGPGKRCGSDPAGNGSGVEPIGFAQPARRTPAAASGAIEVGAAPYTAQRVDELHHVTVTSFCKGRFDP